jgi:hypothetical protein
MKRPRHSARRLAWRIAAVLSGLGLTSMLANGCMADETRFPPPEEGPPNGTTTLTSATGGAGGTGGAAALDLCACAAGLADTACLACNKDVIGTGMACAGLSDACVNDTACTSDAACVGGCLKPAPDATCISACLATATTTYLAYLGCICTRCPTDCASTLTCP